MVIGQRHTISCTFNHFPEQRHLLSTCICNTSSSYLMWVIVCEAVVTLSTCLCFSDECTWLLCEYLAAGQLLWMGQEPGYRALIVLLCGMGCMLGPGSSERNGAATHRPHWGERVHGGGGSTSLRSHTSYLSDFFLPPTVRPSCSLPGPLLFRVFRGRFYPIICSKLLLQRGRLPITSQAKLICYCKTGPHKVLFKKVLEQSEEGDRL